MPFWRHHDFIILLTLCFQNCQRVTSYLLTNFQVKPMSGSKYFRNSVWRHRDIIMTSSYDYHFIFKIARGSNAIMWQNIKPNRYQQVGFSESRYDVIVASSFDYNFVFKIIRGSHTIIWPNIKSNRYREVCFSESRYDVIVTSSYGYHLAFKIVRGSPAINWTKYQVRPSIP